MEIIVPRISFATQCPFADPDLYRCDLTEDTCQSWSHTNDHLPLEPPSNCPINTPEGVVVRMEAKSDED